MADSLEEAKIKAEDFCDRETGEGNYGKAGYYHQKAGLLLEQSFCPESPVFNIHSNDHHRVFEKGWYAIEADFHY